MDRNGYTAGLRHLADLLDENPELPLPYDGTLSSLNWIEHERSTVAAIVRALPGEVTKHYNDDANLFSANTMIVGLKVGVVSDRSTVCERVVIGTETVTVSAQPAVEARTEERDVVEWRCEPLLAEKVSA